MNIYACHYDLAIGSNETEKDFDPNRESLSLRCPFQFVHVKSESENLWCLRKLGGLILVKLFHSL